MIRIHRPSLDDETGLALLQRAGVAKQVLIDSFKNRIKPRVDDNLYRAYKDYLLRAFHDKCAYCESKISAAQPGDVEHYRPKNRVTDDGLKPVKANYPDWGEIDHLGYFWLAYDWDNLLPSCADCNRYRIHPDGRGYGKADRFPVDGARALLPEQLATEKPLLLDPTQTDPNEHFIFFDNGLLRARTHQGLTTINLLGLNTRETLVRERKAEYRSAWRALADYINEARGVDDERIEELRAEVNQIWNGSTRYGAFGRLAIETMRRNYARMGWQMPMPIPPIEGAKDI